LFGRSGLRNLDRGDGYGKNLKISKGWVFILKTKNQKSPFWKFTYLDALKN
jgi:hypothetical protein